MFSAFEFGCGMASVLEDHHDETVVYSVRRKRGWEGYERAKYRGQDGKFWERGRARAGAEEEEPEPVHIRRS